MPVTPYTGPTVVAPVDALSSIDMTLDFGRWTYSELLRYMTAMSKGKIEDIFELSLKVIVTSNLIKRSSTDPFGDLPLPDSTAILRFIGEQLGLLIENINLADYPVNLSRWNTRKYLQWEQVVRGGDAIAIQQWLREVVDYGETPAQVGQVLPELSAVDGAAGMRAVGEAYRVTVTGKP